MQKINHKKMLKNARPSAKSPGATFGRTASGLSQIRALRPAEGSHDG